MEVTKSIRAVYPTVTYGSVEVSTVIKISDTEMPGEIQALPLQEKAQRMDQWVNHLVMEGFKTEYQQVYDNLSAKYLGGIIPPQVEQQLMQTGRLKR